MDYRAEYQKWLESSAVSDEERQELFHIQGDDAAVESSFHAPLSFGTAGLRGILGVGINRMNLHVIRQATQGLAELILREGEPAAKRGVVICHDCRNHSREFAVAAAEVMAGNRVRVYLFEDMRPTPELSFAIREKGAMAGINVTASHNPREYNGYKVYWEDGAQLPPEHAAQVAEIMAVTDIFMGAKQMPLEDAVKAGLITYLGGETDEAFIRAVIRQTVNPGVIARASDRLKIVYTPFHGTGYRIVPEVLTRLGVKQLFCVPEQMVPDGNFSTVKSPNPEDPAGFALALRDARAHNADLIIGTDPDADRISVLVKREGSRGEADYVQITGNQLGVLLLDYLISARREKGTLPENAAAIKTIVTTNLARAVAERAGVTMLDTFTGFKFMAEKIREFEEAGTLKVIFSFEESIGYMVGDFVRDKDAVTAAALIAEMTSFYLLSGLTLTEVLDELYKKHGHYREKTVNLVLPGLDGLAKMKKLLSFLRDHPLSVVGGLQVLRQRDYLDGFVTNTEDQTRQALPMKGSDVLFYELGDGSAFIVRPSGTEPKIKLYLLIRGADEAECAAKITACLETVRELEAVAG
jgi:phosphoglucomutase